MTVCQQRQLFMGSEISSLSSGLTSDFDLPQVMGLTVYLEGLLLDLTARENLTLLKDDNSIR